ESINSAFARFNTIITSLKALDEGYSSKNYVRKFLKALHPNGEKRLRKNLVMRSVRLLEVNTKNTPWWLETSREELDSRDNLGTTKRRSKEAEMTRTTKVIENVLDAVIQIILLEKCPKLPKDKNQRAFVRGSWCDSDEEEDEKAKDVTCLVT
ncbi:hypothetical protein Tco_1167858, partial [Tanacetum coccineum]